MKNPCCRKLLSVSPRPWWATREWHIWIIKRVTKESDGRTTGHRSQKSSLLRDKRPPTRSTPCSSRKGFREESLPEQTDDARNSSISFAKWWDCNILRTKVWEELRSATDTDSTNEQEIDFPRNKRKHNAKTRRSRVQVGMCSKASSLSEILRTFVASTVCFTSVSASETSKVEHDGTKLQSFRKEGPLHQRVLHDRSAIMLPREATSAGFSSEET